MRIDEARRRFRRAEDRLVELEESLDLLRYVILGNAVVGIVTGLAVIWILIR